MDLDARRRAADYAVTEAFALVATYVVDARAGRARFGPVDAIATGSEAAFFNPILVFEPSTAPEDVLAALSWGAGRGVRTSVQVRGDVGPGVRAALETLGLAARDWPTPVMVLEPIPEGERAVPDGLAVRVGGAELFEDFHLAGESGELFRGIFSRAFLDDPSVRIAVGYLDGEAVATASVIRTGEVVGVYAVSTQERARRRGIGRAITWAAIDAGRAAWGNTIVILQSSELGLPVYRSMGFEEVARYIEFEARPLAAGQTVADQSAADQTAAG